MTFELLASDGKARRGLLSLAHGAAPTPTFMPVGTYGTVKAMSPDELVGRACTDLIETRYQEIFTTKIKEANSRFAAKLEMNFTRSDGHVVSTIVTPTPLFNENGRYSGAFAVVTETVFAWPGMGKLIIDSINVLDRPVMVAYLMIIVFLFVFINLAVDLLYTVLDPRVRLESKE